MTIEEAMAVLERGRMEPLYVVSGPNRFWSGEWLNRARHSFLGVDDAGETGFIRLDGVMDFKTVQLELASSGFFAERKIVVVENGRWSKKEETLSRYIENPAPETLLVLLEDKVSPALEKAVGRHRIVELKDLTPVAFRRFVEDEAKRRGVRFEGEGLDTFCRQVQSNEFQAIQELEKLALWTTKPVKGADVMEAVLPIPTDEPLWDVTDAMLRRDGARAMARLEHHLQRGVAPLLLFIMMARQIIQVDQARRAQQAGVTMALFQKEEGLRDFAVKKIWGAARQWSDDEIAQLMDWAAKIDVAMKTGYGEPAVWLMFWTALWAGKKFPPGQQRGGRKDRI